MKIHPFCGVLALLFCSSVLLTAEEPPKPQAPYVAPLPKSGHWKISIQYSNPAAPVVPGAPPMPTPDGLPAALDVVKVGDMKRTMLVFPNGSSSSIDQRGEYVVRLMDGLWRTSRSSGEQTPYPFASSKYPLTEWVNLNSFKEVVKYKGVETFHYVSEQGEEAWIAVDTMLPVAAKQPGAELSYEFLPPPTGALQLAPEEVAIFRQIDRPFAQSP